MRGSDPREETFSSHSPEDPMREQPVLGLGFRVESSGFRVQGLGMKVWDLNFRV